MTIGNVFIWQGIVCLAIIIIAAVATYIGRRL